MCLTEVPGLKTKNLPKSVSGWKAIIPKYKNKAYQTPIMRTPVKFNVTMVAQNSVSGFEDYHGYKCGFHVSRFKKDARTWTNAYSKKLQDERLFPVVAWELTTSGFQSWKYTYGDKIIGEQPTYVAKRMRVFKTIEEAREFKKELDKKLCV